MFGNALFVPNDLLMGEVISLLRQGRKVTLRAVGDSMLPFIIGGRDDVVIEPCERRPVAGEVVLAKTADGKYVLHRILNSDGDRYVLMGDGNISGTEICTVADIAGAASGIRRGDRFVSLTSAGSLRLACFWKYLLPVRRYLLWIWKRVNL